MRRKDWADYEAERLFDLVRDSVDDEVIVEEISASLRSAAKYRHDDAVTGAIRPVDESY